MYKQLILAVGLCGYLAAPALAQASGGASGQPTTPSDYTSNQTWQGMTPGNSAVTPQGISQRTGQQTTKFGAFGPTLPTTNTAQYGSPTGQAVPINALPPTLLDSFVNASLNKDQIYGDEGTNGLPPINGFEFSNTIGSGMTNNNLSTGHASVLPSAWLDGDGFSGGNTNLGGGNLVPGYVVPFGSPQPAAPPMPTISY